VTSWACRVSWKELCPTPRVLSTCNSGDFPPQTLGVCVFCFVLFAGNRHVRGSCHSWAKKRGKSGLKFRTTKNYSTYLAPFHTNGYMAGTGIVRLLSKATNTGFLRHIKTGCHLPVCITIRNKSIRAHKKLYIYKYIYIYIYI